MKIGKVINKEKKKNKIIDLRITQIIFAFLFLLILAALMNSLFVGQKNNLNQLDIIIDHHLYDVGENIEKSYNQAYFALEQMSLINIPVTNSDKRTWDNRAIYTLDTFNEVTSIIFVSEELVIEHIVENRESNLIIGELIKEIEYAPTELAIWIPIKNEEQISGFLLCIIDLAVLSDNNSKMLGSYYSFELQNANVAIYQSNNWVEGDTTRIKGKNIILENNDSFRILIAPTKSTVTELKASSKNFFIFGVVLTIIIAFLYLVLKNSIHKSKKLEVTQNQLIENQEKLSKAVLIANSASKAKSEFLANMSHEIRTPISAIIGMNQLLKKTNMSEKQRDYSYKIGIASHNLMSVINDILDFSKIESGKMIVEITEFDLYSVLEHIINLVAFKANQKEIEFIVKVSKDIPRKLIGDITKLEQIIVNLSGNAIKFTDEGQVFFSVEILSKNDNNVELNFSVKDTGIGLTQTEIGKLFNKFTQVESNVTRKYGGTGLGLSISKKLAELMDGTIDVKSEKNRGSEFSLQIPFKYNSNYIDGKKISSIHNLKAMIVDDSKSAGEVLEYYLSQYSSDIDICFSGEEAINKFKQENNQYDIIFMDWKMPIMNGIETLDEIRALDYAHKTKLVLVTAYLSEQIFTTVEEKYLDAFMYKPITPYNLETVLNRIYLNSINLDNRGDNTDNLNLELKRKIKRMRGKKILLVEDNSINQQYVTEILESIGLIVDIANDGLEAIKLVKSQKPDTYCLILMDLHMPNLGGYDATRLIKEEPKYKKIPIVAMTAEVISDTEKKVYESGMQGYITKPIDTEKLFEYIGSLNCSPVKITDTNNDSISVDILDYKEGVSRLVNNKIKYNKILKDFIIEYDDIYEKLVKSLRIEDYEGFEFLTHTIKGSAGNIAANKLYRSASNLNKLIKQKSYEKCAFNLRAFKKDQDDLFKVIEIYLLKNKQVTLPLENEVKSDSFDLKLIENTFNELIVLFEEDYGLVENKLGILENIFSHSIYKKEWEELISKTEAFDIDGAKNVINKMRKVLEIDFMDK